MQNKISSSKKVLFGILLIFSISSYTHSNECSFDLWPWIAVSIDVTTCKADTVYGSSVYGIDVNAMQGNIAYGEMGISGRISAMPSAKSIAFRRAMRLPNLMSYE